MSSAKLPGAARRLLAPVGLLAVVSVLTGCMELTTSVSVDADRSARVVIDAYPDSDTLIEAGGEEALDRFVEAVDAATAGQDVRLEKLEDRRVPGVRLVLEDVPDVSDLAAPVSVPGGPTIQLFNRFDLVDTEEGWTLDAELPPLSALASALTGGVPEELARAEYEVRISLPGRVVSTNAGEQDGSTAIWTVEPADPAPRRLSMQTETGLQVPTEALAIGGLVLLVILGIVLVVTGGRWRMRRKLRRAARAPSVPGGWGPTGGSTLPAPPRAPGAGSAPDGNVSSPGTGLYSDLTGDTSVALPVGGSSWGPAPPPLPAVEAEPTPAVDPVAAPIAEAMAAEPAAASDPPVEPGPTPRQVVVVPPGWYPDPEAAGRSRFWDGTGWTDHTA